MNENITFVTGLWDIGRGNLDKAWSRGFDTYLEQFEKLLKMPYNLIVYGDSQLEKFVFERRKPENTQFINRSVRYFIDNEYYPLIQQIRQNDKWKQQVGWLKDSTQSTLELYNPLVMTKMFLLNDARILSKFKCTHMFWVDAGIGNTGCSGYFNETNVIDKLSTMCNDFSFICFPYETKTEIHGFEYVAMCRYAKKKVNKVARGGFFGGNIDTFHQVNGEYYSLLLSTLRDGYMGTEESIFTLLVYLHPELVTYYDIEGNGLIYKFFENIKSDSAAGKKEIGPAISSNLVLDKTAVYVISFNSPDQFRALIESWNMSGTFISKTKNFLLDNSTDLSTTPAYKLLCEQYNFEHIKKDNIGICGGRQFVAEHFDSTNLHYYIFLEDDMLLKNELDFQSCKNGFNNHVSGLYTKIHQIMSIHNYDFLKLSFTEFYGDNKTQWAWYNVPQSVRDEVWPEKSKLPEIGLDPAAPRTKFNNIHCVDGLPYADGEIYYCNWPQIVSRSGNKKMFLNTKWQRPYEQTWMSHMFQLSRKGEIKSAVLLATPIDHIRFAHYDGKLRREN